MSRSPANFEDRTDPYIFAVGRLKPGISLDRAQAEMHTIGSQLEREYPQDLAQSSVTVLELRDVLSPRALLLLKVLLGAALCVLLIACTNLANLLLARAMIRLRD